ncbi:MAG: spore coat associated protein CotJA [Firmicutes bacterium]|nr:spore coat associated protein CotJA [Candidatus Fermentithermobacillaceae bacterium]
MSFGELARAYVPVQVYARIFPPEEALRRGSVFPELVRTPPLYQRLD